jgi:hypothetical protein
MPETGLIAKAFLIKDDGLIAVKPDALRTDFLASLHVSNFIIIGSIVQHFSSIESNIYEARLLHRLRFRRE